MSSGGYVWVGHGCGRFHGFAPVGVDSPRRFHASRRPGRPEGRQAGRQAGQVFLGRQRCRYFWCYFPLLCVSLSLSLSLSYSAGADSLVQSKRAPPKTKKAGTGMRNSTVHACRQPGARRSTSGRPCWRSGSSWRRWPGFRRVSTPGRPRTKYSQWEKRSKRRHLVLLTHARR